MKLTHTLFHKTVVKDKACLRLINFFFLDQVGVIANNRGTDGVFHGIPVRENRGVIGKDAFCPHRFPRDQIKKDQKPAETAQNQSFKIKMKEYIKNKEFEKETKR